MSYQVLARKWRPKTFADVVGQEHIITALANGLKDNRLHHAYLFSGTRGVGKTSIARLFAKGLNCVHGVTATPCGECENCKAIEQGNFIDLIEIDAASRTKVEDTRELLDNVQYKPVVGRFKVYLIDEVHMLSRHSFNALLKTLEEPPEYVKFLLATTDPQKLPVTILSRCLQFHLKALDETQISQHLAHILTQENIPFEEPALVKLAKAAQGSIRDSLSLTDQAIAMGDRQVTNSVVSNMLGLLDDNYSVDILYALHQGNGELLMRTLQRVADATGDWDKLLGECAEKLHQIALMQLLPQKSSDDNEHFSFLAKHISPEDVQFFYQVIVSGRKDLSNAPNRRIGTEMTLLRALAFYPKFLTAVPKANTTITPPPSTPSAVENTGNYVDVPVLSQSIKSAYSQAKPNKTSIPNLASLSALDALEHLTQLENQERQVQKAESVAVVNETLHHIQELDEKKSHKNMTALPVREMTETKPKHIEKPTVQPNAAQASQENSTEKNSSDDNAEVAQDEQEILSADTYRWEWSNPELAKADTGVRPSDIKQAILKDITPELRLKIITQTQQQDEWADIVERSGVTGFSKELALNCFLQSKTDNEINLGLHSEKSHLRQDRSIKNLVEALSKLQGKDIRLTINIDDSNVTTPIEYRRNIYQTLREKAQNELQKDNKLQMLLNEFDAKLDVESIRPV
ncbi:DNA polymerase III subunits gamma and tau [Haemophilus influenzae]|uniref:DNA polymerase III subunit gamma/tau n=1 Tax=Haemophilus influenzae TaxID=727 RepID=UPI000DA27E3C|nr:DNA polymerase III subunit gamma/tau [Haemophilus influenzae]SQK94178.1 DNA polymerase III subunits gamma and tau [Haemophilus influenzae]